MPKLLRSELNDYFFKNSGKIIAYDNNGNVIKMFDNWDYIIENSDECKNFLYGVEYYHKKNIIPTRQGIDYYGIKIKQLYDQKSYKYMLLTNLNIVIRKNLPSFLSDRQINNIMKDGFSPFFEKDDRLSYKEIKDKVMNILKEWMLTSMILRNSGKKDYINYDRELYEKEVDKLFKTYSIKKHVLFDKLSNLKKYKNVSGIYLIEIKEKNMCYIGQSKNIYERLRNHFNQISSTDFDNTFGVIDINKIYIMPVPFKYLDDIEKDCVALINRKILLNSMAGGHEIAFLDENYNSSNFILTTRKRNNMKKHINQYKENIFMS